MSNTYRFTINSSAENSFIMECDIDYETLSQLFDSLLELKEHFQKEYFETPDFIDHCHNHEMDFEEICIIDFERKEHIFIRAEIETTVKIY